MLFNNIIHKLKNAEKNYIEYYQKGKKQTVLFREVYSDVCEMVANFETIGIKAGDKIGIIGENCYEWLLIDLSCIYVGAISVPLSPNQKDEIRDLITHFKLDFLFSYYHQSDINARIVNMKEVLESGAKKKNTPWIFKEEDIFTYKFSSGSTSKPKGIETKVKHIEDLIRTTQEMYLFNSRDKFVIFLPLNIFLQRCYLYSAILYDFNILMVPLSLLFESFKRDKPTVLIGVPLFFESIVTNFKNSLRSNSKASIHLKFYLLTKKIAPKLFFKSGYKKFKMIFGTEIRFLLTGSAPISKTTLEFYFLMGLPIYEGYGMNEVGMVALNSPGNLKLGSVGKPFPNKEVKVDASGEIFVKSDYGPNSIYYDQSEEINTSVFRSDGFVATGDQGYFDKNGFLYLSGRIKDLIILSNGNKVTPTMIEEKINNSELIKKCIVYGDNKPYLTALIIPVSENVTYETIRMHLKVLNKSLSIQEKIIDVIIDYEDFSTQNGMLNSNLKINRKAILTTFKSQFEELYIK